VGCIFEQVIFFREDLSIEIVGNPRSLPLPSIGDEYNLNSRNQIGYFLCNSAFVIYYTCNIDSVLHRSVEGLLMQLLLTISRSWTFTYKHIVNIKGYA